MQSQEQQPQPGALEGMPEPQESEEQRFKTMAVRVEESLHAQLRFIAQLSGRSLSDEIRGAIEHRIATAQDDPELIARAQQARDQIEREAAARAAAIAGFMGMPAVAAATSGSPTPTNPRTRRSNKPSNE